MKLKHVNIPVFVPHYGCMHACVFCNQRKITDFSGSVTVDSARNIIETYLKTIERETTEIEIAFFGGSFTAVDRNLQISLLALAKQYLDAGKIDGIRLSTRPDCIDDAVLSYMKDYGVTTIELGVQSMDEQVLRLSNRGHTPDAVIESSRLIQKYGFSLGLQMMLGLPADTDEKCMDTAKKIVAIHPDCVRIYPTLVLKDTPLATMYLSGEYQPLTLLHAVKLCAQLLDLFEENHIPVIRVGLLGNDSIAKEGDLVAGPFHPAFREIVESRRYLDRILAAIRSQHISGNSLQILVHPSIVSKVIGYQKQNIIALRESFREIKVSITPDIETFLVQ